jgi:hypothetical protein
LVFLPKLFQPGVGRLDLGIKEAKLAHQAVHQEAMVIANAAFQGQLEVRDFTPQLT